MRSLTPLFIALFVVVTIIVIIVTSPENKQIVKEEDRALYNNCIVKSVENGTSADNCNLLK